MVKFIGFPESCPHFKSHWVQIHLLLLASSTLHIRVVQNQVHKMGGPWPHPTTSVKRTSTDFKKAWREHCLKS